MKDSLYFYPRNTKWQTETQGGEAPLGPQIDLSTFAQWIELQPISTHAGLLELIGNDLYRRHWPTIAAECKRTARDLRALAKFSAHDTLYTCWTCPQCGSVFQWPSPLNVVHCDNCGYEARQVEGEGATR